MKKKYFTPLDAIIQNAAQAKKQVLTATKLNIDFVPTLLSFYNNYEEDDFVITFAWKSIHLKDSEMLIFAFEEDIKLPRIYENYDCITLAQESTFIIKDRFFTIKHSYKGYELMELAYLYSEREAKAIAKVINPNLNLKWNLCLAYIDQKPACFVWQGSSAKNTEELQLPVFNKDADLIKKIDYVIPINKNKPFVDGNSIYEIEKSEHEGLVIKRICSKPSKSLPS